MRAGRMRFKARFERETRVPDGAGGSASTWAELATMSAALMPLRGDETVAAGILTAKFAKMLTVRSSSVSRAITESDRVVVDNSVWNIRSITDPDGKRERLEMMIERGVGQ